MKKITAVARTSRGAVKVLMEVSTSCLCGGAGRGGLSQGASWRWWHWGLRSELYFIQVLRVSVGQGHSHWRKTFLFYKNSMWGNFFKRIKRCTNKESVFQDFFILCSLGSSAAQLHRALDSMGRSGDFIQGLVKSHWKGRPRRMTWSDICF